MKKLIAILITAVIAVSALASCGVKPATPLDTADESSPELANSTNPAPIETVVSDAGDISDADDTSNDASADSPDDTSSEEPDEPITFTLYDPAEDGFKTKVTVTDALSYKKDYSSFKIPKLTAKTGNAKKFNDKIYNTFSDSITAVKKRKTNGLVYDVTYDFTVRGRYVAIITRGLVGEEDSCAGVNCRGFYYDLKEDRELTFDEYLSGNGVTRAILLGLVKKSDYAKETVYEVEDINELVVENLPNAMIADDKTSIIVEVFEWEEWDDGSNVKHVFAGPYWIDLAPLASLNEKSN